MSATRRDILAGLLGLPIALAAGCGRAPPLPPGDIVGVSLALGHRLREGPPPAPADWLSVPVVIVGAGIAGLAAAWRLKRAGFEDFVLLELEREPGGTARSGRDGVVPHPWGAHYLPAPLKDNRALLTLLKEMDLVEGHDRDGEPLFAEEALVRDPHERLYFRSRWQDGLYLHAGETAEDQEQWARFEKEIDRWVAWRDAKGRRAFAVPMATGSDDAEVTALDRQRMADWLDERGFTSARLRWLVDYGCRDDYGLSLTDTSAWAGLFYFAARRRAPGAEPQPYLSWPEGNGRLVAHLAKGVKGKLRTGLAVAELVPTQRDARPGVDVIALAETGGSQGIRADQVLFAAPQFLTRYVLRPYRDAPPRHVAAFEYGSWMVANLHLRGRPVEDDSTSLAWDNVLYESPSLGYVVATHQRGLDHGPTIFTYYYPLCDSSASAGRGRLLSLGRDEWADVALTDLQRAHSDLRGLTGRLDVMRWGHAMIRPRPGFVWGTDRRAAAQPFRGVHFAHSDLSGVALFEEAFYHGLRGAEEVLTARGIGFTSML